MSQKSRAVLKTKFESGRTPTERDFSDVLDSGLNKVDDQLATRVIEGGEEPSVYFGVGTSDPESPVSIKNRSGAPNLIGFQHENDELWQIEINPEQGVAGLNIREKDKEEANLFIQSGGNVGIGSKEPKERLEIKGKVKAEEFVGTLDWTRISNAPHTSFVPKGLIAMWSGPSDEIPEGWVICDGYKSSPDLRGRFIVGSGKRSESGNDSSPDYATNDKGGSNEVKLQGTEIPSHSHGSGTLVASSVGDHSHRFGTGRKNNNGGIPMKAGSHDFSPGAGSTDPAGAHSHSISGTTGNSGGNQAHENRPPYYALCFIMKT